MMKSVRMLKTTWIINLYCLASLELLQVYTCIVRWKSELCSVNLLLAGTMEHGCVLWAW